MDIKLSPLAREDLGDIWHYIALDNEEKATELVVALQKRIQELSDFPSLGVHRKWLKKDERMLIVGNYNIFYRTKREFILILRILHGNREIKDFF